MNEIKLEDLSTDTLKAMAYDNIKHVETLQRNLQYLNSVIEQREAKEVEAAKVAKMEVVK